ncbi:hypothetical protein K432DRAFT_231022 [Lepidopterella palustris CBS 459.81]|uniref:Uncharacterized protein n=1 Tax=Lepidopterella palustris CBS 459.81 TaxID=1314670 RepID=A0A8E2JHH3_9PEZI|nr:hypothetical protein K432DRAFT_231022 [Lepidopterella palustris CBS 459.81]
MSRRRGRLQSYRSRIRRICRIWVGTALYLDATAPLRSCHAVTIDRYRSRSRLAITKINQPHKRPVFCCEGQADGHIKASLRPRQRISE